MDSISGQEKKQQETIDVSNYVYVECVFFRPNGKSEIRETEREKRKVSLLHCSCTLVKFFDDFFLSLLCPIMLIDSLQRW
jgi:hypothetical protein